MRRLAADDGSETTFLGFIELRTIAGTDGMALYLSHALSQATQAGPAFVSFDIDGCAEAYAPAVSAPSADGFTPRQAVEAAFLAGQHEQVRLFEVVELNPHYDRDNQTARLAATIITAFLTGVAASLRK